jgi:hypothetical protein
MSRFIIAMDVAAPSPLPVNKQLGENSSPEITTEGVADPRVALFFALVRGIEQSRVSEMVDSILATERADLAADALVLAFQTRNCRGGKGERTLFHWMIIELFKSYPETVTELLALIPEHGFFKDWFQIIALVPADSPLAGAIYTLAVNQLIKDRGTVASNGESGPSLLAKWAPREKRAMAEQAEVLAKKLFPASRVPKKDYRHLIASINKVLNTTEIRMCANEWDHVRFGAVPSRAMLKYRKAFLNEKVDSVPASHEDETGNRHPKNNVRVACRKRLREELVEQKICKLKGKQLFPHELTSKFSRGNISTLEADVLQQQWNDIRENVKAAMSTAGDGDGKAVDLGKLVAIADVSGSMKGTPMDVSIALSILVSELAAPEFANRFITFSESPTWIALDEGMTLSEKVRTTANAPWGMNTDFAKAMDLILTAAVIAKLKPNEIPDLIVFSDMQFDAAACSYGRKKQANWETQHERLVRKFKDAGMKACGEPWSPPQIIYWNLRGDTNGFPAQADTAGVTMLSGFSPSLLKLLLSGKALEQEIVKEVINEDGDVVVVKEKVKTPYDTLRAALDDIEYDKVREVLGRSKEGLLAEYVFEPRAVETEWVLET